MERDQQMKAITLTLEMKEAFTAVLEAYQKLYNGRAVVAASKVNIAAACKIAQE